MCLTLVLNLFRARTIIGDGLDDYIAVSSGMLITLSVDGATAFGLGIATWTWNHVSIAKILKRERDLLKFRGFTLREPVRVCIDLMIKHESGDIPSYQVENQLDIVARKSTDLGIATSRDLSFSMETKRTNLLQFLIGMQQFMDAGDLDGARLRSRPLRDR